MQKYARLITLVTSFHAVHCAIAQPPASTPPVPSGQNRPFSLPSFKADEFHRIINEKEERTLILVVADGSYREVMDVWNAPSVKTRLDQGLRVMIAHQGFEVHRKAIWEVVPGLPVGVYAIRAGVVIDQDVPFAKAEYIDEWLGRVLSGTLSEEYFAARAGPRTDSCALEPHLVYARRLDRLGKPEAAAEVYTWVLEQFYRLPRPLRQGDPAITRPIYLYEFNNYNFEPRLKQLAKVHPAITVRIASLRDEMRTKAEAEPKPGGWTKKWFLLAAYAPDTDRMLSYYDAVQNDPARQKWAGPILDDMMDSLSSSGHWSELGQRLREPVAIIEARLRLIEVLNRSGDGPKSMEEAAPAVYNAAMLQGLTTAGIMYASVLAADRDAEAEKIASTVFAHCKRPMAMAVLVAFALEADQVRPVHLQWAKEVDALPDRKAGAESMAAKVEAALLRGEASK